MSYSNSLLDCFLATFVLFFSSGNSSEGVGRQEEYEAVEEINSEAQRARDQRSNTLPLAKIIQIFLLRTAIFKKLIWYVF